MQHFMSLKDLPMASFAKAVFFAVHLFKEQIFSMSEHVEMFLADFLRVNRGDCCNKNECDLLKDKKGCPVWIYLCHYANHTDDWNQSLEKYRRRMDRWVAIHAYNKDDYDQMSEEQK